MDTFFRKWFGKQLAFHVHSITSVFNVGLQNRRQLFGLRSLLSLRLNGTINKLLVVLGPLVHT